MPLPEKFGWGDDSVPVVTPPAGTGDKKPTKAGTAMSASEGRQARYIWQTDDLAIIGKGEE
jgi:hypothetical protein